MIDADAHPEGAETRHLAAGGNRGARHGWIRTGAIALAPLLAATAGGLLLFGPSRTEYRVLDDEAASRRPPSEELAGDLTTMGSDTMHGVMSAWTDAFAKLHPAVRPSVSSRGSGTAPPALTLGAALLGPMTRSMKPDEARAFQTRLGYPPTEVRVAFDAIRVYVHRDNPIASLTVAQLTDLYSATTRTHVGSWKDLGLGGEWARTPIDLYGRNQQSMAFAFMKGRVLHGSELAPSVRDTVGYAALVEDVSRDRGGVGYGSIRNASRGVRVVPLAEGAGEPVAPDDESIRSGRYPLSRPLLVYARKEPGRGMAALVRAFLEFVLSEAGREIAAESGLIPVSDAIAAEESAKLR